MQHEVIDFDELKLSDQLAIERTAMAADRSLLAWVRTSLSLISFGFTIFKVLDNLLKVGDIKHIREQTPRNLGIFLILIGIVPLALAMFQYRRGMQRMGRQGPVYEHPSMVAAFAILLLGIALLVVTVANLSFF